MVLTSGEEELVATELLAMGSCCDCGGGDGSRGASLWVSYGHGLSSIRLWAKTFETKPRRTLELWENHGYHILCFLIFCKGPCRRQEGFRSRGMWVPSKLELAWMTRWTP